MLTNEQRHALDVLAKSFRWDDRSIEDMAVIMWAAVHYYVMRLGREQPQ